MNMDSARPSPIPLEIWGATDKGRQREGNEDAIYPHSGVGTFPFQPDPTRLAHMGQVMLVADGVGGGGSGSEASRWVRRVMVERYYDSPPNNNPGYNLQQAVLQANTALYQYIQSTGARDAGSTIVATVVYGDILYVAHVGDSRAYLFRNGQVDRITRDHTLAQQKYDMGQITLQQLGTDPDRSVLIRSMGISPTVAVDLNHRRLSPGDVILLCSDGLTDVVWEEEIAQTVQKYPPRRAAQELIKLANQRGGPDNISVVIARVGGQAAARPARRRAGAGRAAARPARRRAGAGLAALAGWQKGVLAAMTVALLAVCGLLGWAVLGGFQNRGGGPTATPVPTLGASPITTLTAAAPTTAPTAVPGEGRPTSTPVPTPTPTPTRVPPTKTPTPLPTPTPTPTAPPPPGGEQPPPPPPGGEQPPPPPPTNPPPPPPTNPPPPTPG